VTVLHCGGTAFPNIVHRHTFPIKVGNLALGAEVSKGKGVYFYLQALSAKGWSPKREEG